MPGFYDNYAGRYVDVDWLYHGRWFTDDDGFLYIVPVSTESNTGEDLGTSEIDGPDNEICDTLAAVCRENGGELPDDFDPDSLGLYEVDEHLKRFSEEEGYYHA